MDYNSTIRSALNSSWIILKLIIPIYIIADILYYYNLLSHVAFLVEPFTSFLGLPTEASLAIISGMFLNLYAAIAFAAPLDMTPQQWTILAVFLGICHSLVVEGVIMKKLGISNFYSYSLRIISGFLVAYIVVLLPSDMFTTSFIANTIEQAPQYNSFFELLSSSIYNAIILSVKIIILIVALIFIMDYVKSLPFIQKSQKNISKGFSIGVGVFLGITYGAGILIKEAQSSNLSKNDIFFIGTFLMICHAIVEDTLLFVIFGADLTIVIVVRTIAAIVLSYLLLYIYKIKTNTLEK